MFTWRNKENINTFGLKKSILSRAMELTLKYSVQGLHFLDILDGPCKAKKCLQTCAKCKDSVNPAHVQKVIRAFALHSYIL